MHIVIRLLITRRIIIDFVCFFLWLDLFQFKWDVYVEYIKTSLYVVINDDRHIVNEAKQDREKKMKQIRQHWTDVNVKRSLCHISSLFRCAIVKTTWRERKRERIDSKLWEKRERKKAWMKWSLCSVFFCLFIYTDIGFHSVCKRTHWQDWHD